MERKENARKIVVTAMLIAIIVVIQSMLSGLNIAGFPITLTLVPIIIGATMLGPTTGAVLGGAFGVVVCAGVISGADVLGNLMLQENPVLTLFVCMLKGILAGYISGLVFSFFKKRNKDTAGIFVAAILCPVINTSTLLIAMVAFFNSVVTKFALDNGFPSAVKLILSGILLMNFLPELLVNIIVSPSVGKVLSKIKS